MVFPFKVIHWLLIKCELLINMLLKKKHVSSFFEDYVIQSNEMVILLINREMHKMFVIKRQLSLVRNARRIPLAGIHCTLYRNVTQHLIVYL